jgi:hypothetical protein
MQSTPYNSLGVLSGDFPLAERCMYLNYRYLITVFHKHGHPVMERLETLNKLNSERCLKGFPSIDKSMYPSVASRELATITSDYATGNMVEISAIRMLWSIFKYALVGEI